MWFEGSVKGFGVQIEILASVFDWISKQQLNLSFFLWDWYCRKLGLTDLPGHNGKVTSDINFILSPYYSSLSADGDFLYESLLNSGLLWAMTWNNEYESDYESVSRISIWINFPSDIWGLHFGTLILDLYCYSGDKVKYGLLSLTSFKQRNKMAVEKNLRVTMKFL